MSIKRVRKSGRAKAEAEAAAIVKQLNVLADRLVKLRVGTAIDEADGVISEAMLRAEDTITDLEDISARLVTPTPKAG